MDGPADTFRTLLEVDRLLEAPRPVPDGSVLFANATAGGVYRWSAEGVTEVLARRRGVGGIAVHQDGGWVIGTRPRTH